MSEAGSKPDVDVIAAFPKSGITFLNYMLFHALFDHPEDRQRIDRNFIIDIHEHAQNVPPPDGRAVYIKSHAPFSPALPLRDRLHRVVQLVRHPIDVMMSVWDFEHLIGNRNTEGDSGPEQLRGFVDRWIATGGLHYQWVGSWLDHVRSWLAQTALPTLVVRYEDLRLRPAEELARIFDFLDRPVAPERIAAAMAASSVEKMRADEANEAAAGLEGAFYRRYLEAGYAKGHRFVGKLHQDAYHSVLDQDQRDRADRAFGAVLAEIGKRAAQRPGA